MPIVSDYQLKNNDRNIYL